MMGMHDATVEDVTVEQVTARDVTGRDVTAPSSMLGEPEMLAEELVAVLGNLRRQTRRNIGRPWPVETLSGSQSELMRLIRRQPGISVTEAAAELGLAANSVSTLVRQLATQSLIVRVPDRSDRRIARLTLTDVARKRAEDWLDRRASLFAAVLRRLEPSELRSVSDAVPVLRRIADEFASAGEQSPVALAE
jgi:DNA-binding MarR family transcriptional regulator